MCSGKGLDDKSVDKTEQDNEQTTEPSKPQPVNKKTTIYPQQLCGRVTEHCFYDVKQGNVNPIPVATASVLFGDIKMDGIRVPIYGTATEGGHTGPGDVGENTYSKILTSISRARNAYTGEKPFIIFASKKLDGKNSFPSWVKDKNGVLPDKYAVMLYDYLRFMKDHGYEIDVLGIDNETNFNEGNITAVVYGETIDKLKNMLDTAGIKIPLFVGHERYNPETKTDSWLADLFNNGLQNRLDIYATHYYPKHHTTQYNKALKTEWELVNSDKSRPFWATEPHWNNDDVAKADMLFHSESAMGAMFDQTDLGMDCFCWWGFKYEGSLRGYLMNELTRAIYGSQPIVVKDHDGDDIRTPGTFKTRAFIRGNEVSLFILNICESGKNTSSYSNYDIVIDGRKLNSAKAIQWRDGTPDEGQVISLRNTTDNKTTLTIPSRSITRVSISLQAL